MRVLVARTIKIRTGNRTFVFSGFFNISVTPKRVIIYKHDNLCSVTVPLIIETVPREAVLSMTVSD